MLMTIRENLAVLQKRIEVAASKAGRQAAEITLIGVSKTHPGQAVREAYEAGLRHFGENRVQEWEKKQGILEDLHGARWHLIGHLQSNKAGKAAKLFHSVDSVDDWELAQKLDRACEGKPVGEKLRVLVEVQLGGEETKTGVAEGGLEELTEKIVTLGGIHFCGLMCIPPYQENQEHARPYFARLRELRDSLEGRLGQELPTLSMGMSHDFEAAISEGATEVRVGTALFGTRALDKGIQQGTEENKETA
jgi:pyridoxal phosphate enzyme (YggS family)